MKARVLWSLLELQLVLTSVISPEWQSGDHKWGNECAL